MNDTPSGLGFVRTAFESARQTIVCRDQRLTGVVVGVTILVFAISYFLVGRLHERLDARMLYCLLTWWLVGTVLLPWTSLYLGIQAVHGGLEDRTFQYLFLRPVSRAGILFGKWMAIVVMTVGLGLLGAAAPFLGIAARPELWRDGVDGTVFLVFARTFAVGAVAYASAAVWFGSWFRRPLVWAAFFVVGLQMLAANLPVSAGLRSVTITDPLRRIVLDGIEPDQRLTEILWPAERRIGLDEVGQPLLQLGIFAAVTLVLAMWSYSRTEYESRSRE